MQMKIKCDYCGNYIEQSSETCEHCGAPNTQYKRTASLQPETIEQLKDWYVAHNLPDENVTRFFIGKDYKGARAFGIYRDSNGDFVVYKNKSDGTRAERYRGDDEAFAVNELYQKLRSEIVNQKARNGADSSGFRERILKKMIIGLILSYFSIFLIVGVMSVVLANLDGGHKSGYYRYEDKYYYYFDDNFYYYNDTYDDWTKYSGDFAEDVEEYYVDDDVPEYVDNFRGSSAYEQAYQDYLESQTYDDDDWDSDSTWDTSDSWDSGGTDWGSDW